MRSSFNTLVRSYVYKCSDFEYKWHVFQSTGRWHHVRCTYRLCYVSPVFIYYNLSIVHHPQINMRYVRCFFVTEYFTIWFRIICFIFWVKYNFFYCFTTLSLQKNICYTYLQYLLHLYNKQYNLILRFSLEQ